MGMWWNPLTQLRISPRNARPSAVRGIASPTMGGEGRVRGAARTDAIRSKTGLTRQQPSESGLDGSALVERLAANLCPDAPKACAQRGGRL
jgi:hypothetical protein